MRVCIYIRIYLFIRVCARAYKTLQKISIYIDRDGICVYTYMFKYINISTFIHVDAYIRIYIFMYLCIKVHIYINIHINTYIFIYTYLYIHIYKFTNICV
jgi:hypothetical protein